MTRSLEIKRFLKAHMRVLERLRLRLPRLDKRFYCNEHECLQVTRKLKHLYRDKCFELVIS